MKNNPVVPYILIFALGLGLIFFMSLYGIEQKDEIAGADEEGKLKKQLTELQLRILILRHSHKENVLAVMVAIWLVELDQDSSWSNCKRRSP